MAPLTVGERWENPRTGTSMEVIGPNEVRRVIKPGKGKLQPHYGLDYVETFVIESGRALAKLDGRKLELGPGDEMVVPKGVSHVNPYNRGTDDLVYRQRVDPMVPFIEGFVHTYGPCLAQDRCDRQDEQPLTAIFGVAALVEVPSYAAGIPRALQHMVIPLGARIARMRGYPVSL